MLFYASVHVYVLTLVRLAGLLLLCVMCYVAVM